MAELSGANRPLASLGVAEIAAAQQNVSAQGRFRPESSIASPPPKQT